MALLEWAVGMGLLVFLDLAIGVGLLAWVSHVYISTCSYLVLAPWTTLHHLGLQSGGTLHPQSFSGVSRGICQMLGAGRPLHGMTGFWVI